MQVISFSPISWKITVLDIKGYFRHKVSNQQCNSVFQLSFITLRFPQTSPVQNRGTFVTAEGNASRVYSSNTRGMQPDAQLAEQVQFKKDLLTKWCMVPDLP